MASLSPGGNVTMESIRNMYNSDMHASEILDLFSKSCSSLLNFMNNNQITDDYVSLLIHLIAKSCRDNSTAQRQNILNLLQNFAASSTLASRGTRLLVGITCRNQHMHQFSCLVSDFVDIIQELHTRMPTLCHTTPILGLLEFLEKQIPECDQFENVEILLENVCQLKASILSNAQNRSKNKRSKLSKQEEDDLKPPEDFRNIPVVPQERDFFNQVTFLRQNKAFGKYLDLNHYLDVQFRLYREDCIAPLRDALSEFLQKHKETQSRNFRLENGLIYRNIIVIKQAISIESGEVFEIALDKEHVKRINWTKSKRLIYGSLLLLSFDYFQTIFRAVVVESDRKTLQRKGSFTVQVFKSGDNHKLPRNTHGLMIEATSAYFEAYKHVLKALQTMGSSTTIFPFERYLVKCEPDILPPTYITEDSKYDVQPIIKNYVISLEESKPKKSVINAEKLTNKIDSREVKLLDEDNWPSTQELRMDKSQREAFISALTKEFVLIQGPPGTGKTYLGLQIAKALLHNTKTWSCDDQMKDSAESIHANIENEKIPHKPYMLVVCYTNHALDQFVEGIVDFMPSQSSRSSYPNVVRFGNQSKNPNVEKFSIKHIRSKVRRLFGNHRFGVLDTATEIKRQIKEIRELLNGIKNRNIVLGIDCFRNVMTNIHWQNFGVGARRSAWYQWLHVTTDAWYKEVNKQYLNQGAPIEPLAEKHTSIDDEEFVTVVSDSEHAFNERYLDLDDVKIQVKIENFGLDLDQQLQKQYRKDPRPEEECLRILKHEKEKAEKELHNGPSINERKSDETKNLWKLLIEDRWKMYRFWKRKYIEHLYEQLRNQEKRFNDIFEEYTSASREMDETIMQNAAVVAMTTTSAGRYNESFSKVAPRVVIIEEAAEVPETHILTSINPKCQHIILIGDHKQLEPKPAVYKLAKEYNLSISLFERMLNNGLSYHCLQRQHRMRPEISALVRHIYPALDDNENVLMYEHIRGISKSLFFISHDHKEKYNDEGRSYSNDHEAEYLKELCMYLLKQGYQKTEITILAAYSGQMFCLKEKMLKSKFEGVHICVLDNYQGEENEIILLSLVRSNDNGDIGFLNRENRICVALSRARKGLYIIGNSKTLTKKSKHWKTIIQKLKGVEENCSSEKDVAKDKTKIAFGKALPLYCQNHPDSNGILAKHPHDFDKVPDGGCNLACEFKLDCDHSCRYKCHPFDKEHKEYICKKQCLKPCPEGHECTKWCHFPTYCVCNVSMKRELPCKHIVNLKCHVDYLQHTCTVLVSRKLECGHTANMECNVNPQTFLCKVIMEKSLDCGHSANIECHMDIKRYNCKQVIKSRRSECGHCFERQCYDTLFEQQYKCKDIITVQRSTCEHEYQRQCYDIAYEQNNPCREIVTDKWPSCAHTYERYCRDKAYNTVNKCKEVVAEVRPECGHKYKRQCYDIEYVVREKCSTITTKTFPACGHQIVLPCHTEIHSQKCNKTILSNFECGHSRRHACCESTNVKCISRCLKRCKNEHTCQQPCHFPDSCNCETLVDVILDKCKHHQMIPCSTDPQNFDCKEMVKKTIPVCGHQQQMECHRNPEKFKCMASVRKSFPSCEHKQIIACFADITGIKCTNPVDVILPNCGHKAKTECWKKYADTSDVQCHSVVVKIRPNCGHSTHIECWQKDSSQLLPCDSVIELNLKCGHVLKSVCSNSTKEHECKEICGKRMSCGHPCPIVCSTCQTNKQHGNCKVKCDEELLCGHLCNCTCMKCTPCQQQCECSCIHSKCSLRCIDPCIPCNENCTWQCPHFKCTKLCSEECNRPICNKVCDKKLTCGHLCNGFCGEPCPEFCIRCKPEMFVGMTVASEVDRVVTLPLCGHSFTRTFMDTVVKKTKNKIWPRCPSCNTVIYFHPRYNDILNRKKILFEHAKRIIRDVMFTQETVFPTFDVQFMQNVEVYAGSFATYLRIVKHLPYANNLKELLDASQNLVREVISTIQKPFHDFNSHLAIAKQNLQMFVKWITCLSSTKPNVLNKYYTISICSGDLDIYTFRRDDGLKLTDRKSMTGADILSVVCKVVDTLQIDYILDILQPLLKEIGRNTYLEKAKQFPQQLKVIGVHFNDWRVCKKEHMTSCVLNSSCDICNSEIDLENGAVVLKNNPSLEPTQRKRIRMRARDKRKDKVSHDKKNNDLTLANNIYERIPLEVLKKHSGRGRNIGSEHLLGTNKSKYEKSSISNKKVKGNTMKDHQEDVVALKNTPSLELEPTQRQRTRKRGRDRRTDKTIHDQKNNDPLFADKTYQRAELEVNKKRNSTRGQVRNIESKGLLNKNKSEDKKSPDLSENVKGNSKIEHREDVVLKHTPSKAPTDRQRTRKMGLDIRKDKTIHDQKSNDPSVSGNAYERAELEVKKKQNSNMGRGRNVERKGLINKNKSDDKKSSRSSENVKVNKTTKRPD